jgi:putative endonuclease
VGVVHHRRHLDHVDAADTAIGMRRAIPDVVVPPGNRAALGAPRTLVRFARRWSRQVLSTLSRRPGLRYDARVTNRRRLVGQAAEAEAAAFLERAGLRVVERNVRFALGELDLVCRDGDRVVFVEVKCRQARWGDAPGAAVSWHKQRRLVQLAQLYLKARGLRDARCRFDVVAVTEDDERRLTVRHLPGAFDGG